VKTRHSDETESLCPVCLRRIKAKRVAQDDDIFLVKECADHGVFKTVMWRGRPSMEEWRRPKDPVHPDLCYGTLEKGCPFDCGLCEAHEQLPCSVLLEVTDQCNLRCAVCFADSGPRAAAPAKPTAERKTVHSPPAGIAPLEGMTPLREQAQAPLAEDLALEKIAWLLGRSMAAVGPSNLQLSGGEPTLRDDLPEIVDAARQVGYSFIQVNTNGIRLASDTGYARRLQAAGLSSVFLQFDGADDEINRSLRGRALLEIKRRAVRNCGEAGIGVVLVPTLVKGVNTDSIGGIVREGLELAPTVRGIHFQPVSRFGRFPAEIDGDQGRFTLPELMRCLEEQTDGLVKVTDFSPPGCEHAHCSFHATYMRSAGGGLRVLGAAQGTSCCSADFGAGGVRKTVETVSRRWMLPSPVPSSNRLPLLTEAPCCGGSNPEVRRVEDALDLDTFLEEIATRSFTISAMAFQDADNLDLERLRGCCISVISPDGKLVPFCAYNLTSREGKSLYRHRDE
jgi:uncharacterized radical SAM superfamily Fe-S cluster-containing enzyme